MQELQSKAQQSNLLPYAALAAGFIAILSNFYYMQVLSYSVGVVGGAASIIKHYNITPSNSLIASISESSAISIAVHITYVMLPFALIIFAIGIIGLFVKYNRALGFGMLFSSVVFGMLLFVLNSDFYLGIGLEMLAFAGVVLGIASSLVFIARTSKKRSSKALRQISINPDTPYSNIIALSRKFFGKLSGDIEILDMHFDEAAIENLSLMLKGNSTGGRSIRILTSASRLGSHFDRSYFDFKQELSNKGVLLELRVMSDSDAQQQHERLVIDSNGAYKIPPLNIINKKSEHIVSISRPDAQARFDEIWQRSTKYENYVKK